MTLRTGEPLYTSPEEIQEISRVFPKVPKVSREANFKIEVMAFQRFLTVSRNSA